MHSVLSILIVSVVLVHFTLAAPVKQKEVTNKKKEQLHWKAKGNRLSHQAVTAMKHSCKNTKKNGCASQTEEYMQKRQSVKEGLLNETKYTNESISMGEAEKEAELRLNKIQDIGKKLNELNDMIDIVPADVGAYQGDIMLSIAQADVILEALNEEGNQTETRPKRSAAEYFEQWPSYKWASTIKYWISPDFLSPETNTIDDALKTISTSIGCVKFTKDTTRLTSGSQIQFIKMGTGCEGVSPLGHQGINTIQLGISRWCSGDVLKALIMHQVIHSLGGGHEQSRIDRDKYINILWDQLDPQAWTQYSKDPYSTSYGVKYDYKSIMHYSQGLFAVSDSVDTMEPAETTLVTSVGSSTLTANDILQLKRMYCKGSECKDKDINCGYWTTIGNCERVDYREYMRSDCSKSCGLC